MKQPDTVIQDEVDQTAPIVYEAARRAVESENSVYRAELLHEEDLHVNLGRTQQEAPIEEDQFRRPGGGNYIIHDSETGEGTYCFIDARVKNGPKEMTGLQRERMAFQALHALSDLYENVGVIDGTSYIRDLEENTIPNEEEAAYYRPEEGDIYLKNGMMPRYDDPQIAGIGLAEVEVDDEWVQIGRFCMYPEQVSDEAVELDAAMRNNQEFDDMRSLDERVEPVRDLESVRDALGGKGGKIKAQDFLSEESIERGRVLQKVTGSRPADPCF